MEKIDNIEISSAEMEKMVRNQPSELGRQLGERLWKLTTKAAKEMVKKLMGANSLELMPQMCASCAFKKDTFPNGCLETTMDAMKCVMEGKAFFCHHDQKDGKPTKICSGYIIARTGMIGREPVKIPWDYSHQVKVDKIPLDYRNPGNS